MNRRFNVIRLGVVSAAATIGAAAHAALPAGVDTAISGASTDGVALLGLLAAAGAAVYLLGKVLGRMGVKL